MGSFLAIVLPSASEQIVRRTATIVLSLSVLTVVLTEWYFGEKTWFLYSGLALAFAAVLCLSINSELLKNRSLLAYTGKISFGLYLIHVPVFDMLREPKIRSRLSWFHSPALNDLVLLVCMILAVYFVASASWHFFESPILKLKNKFKEPATPKTMDFALQQAK